MTTSNARLYTLITTMARSMKFHPWDLVSHTHMIAALIATPPPPPPAVPLCSEASTGILRILATETCKVSKPC